jgi:hypothetical protein
VDKAEFLKNQFLTLRKEIEESKNRVFQTMGFGLVVVPGSHYLAQAYKIDTVVLSLPILVVVVALVYLSENNAIMRCGRYIKHHIEPQIVGTVGWEAWLETKSTFDTRAVDNYLSYAFYLLFFVYFAGSVFMAARFSLSEYGVIVAAALLGAYVGIGVWFIVFLLRSSKVSTTTAGDAP